MSTGHAASAIASGDSPDVAIARWMDLYGGRIYALALRTCGNPQDAEDVVQETFLQAFRKWDQFRGRSAPSTWLYTIASRICKRRLRRRAGQPKRIGSLDELLPFTEPAVAEIPGQAPDPADAQIRREGRERIEAGIAALPAGFRLPLLLKDIMNVSIAEVAGILGLKPATVKSRIHRGRLRLRQALTKAFPRRKMGPSAYSRRVCLDLLRAKQEALDRGVAFPLPSEIVCQRCKTVFATLELTRNICQDLAEGDLPAELRRLILERTQ